MSKELDARIDAVRDKLIKAANTQIGMGNYRQVKRTMEEVVLEVVNITDEINANNAKLAEGEK